MTQITQELVKNEIEGKDIGIITPYNSQANLIRHSLSVSSVEIHTIDKYQVRLKNDCQVHPLSSTLHAACNNNTRFLDLTLCLSLSIFYRAMYALNVVTLASFVICTINGHLL